MSSFIQVNFPKSFSRRRVSKTHRILPPRFIVYGFELLVRVCLVYMVLVLVVSYFLGGVSSPIPTVSPYMIFLYVSFTTYVRNIKDKIIPSMSV